MSSLTSPCNVTWKNLDVSQVTSHSEIKSLISGLDVKVTPILGKGAKPKRVEIDTIPKDEYLKRKVAMNQDTWELKLAESLKQMDISVEKKIQKRLDDHDKKIQISYLKRVADAGIIRIFLNIFLIERVG